MVAPVAAACFRLLIEGPWAAGSGARLPQARKADVDRVWLYHWQERSRVGSWVRVVTRPQYFGLRRGGQRRP